MHYRCLVGLVTMTFLAAVLAFALPGFGAPNATCKIDSNSLSETRMAMIDPE